MCPPTLYDVNYVINPWMIGNINRSSRQRATEQWTALHKAMTNAADVLLVEPQPGSPDMVFTANAGLVRDGVVALSSFYYPERQGEEPHFRRWFQESGFAVCEVPRGTPFEGEGDALFEADGSRLWAGHGPRTGHNSHGRLTELWDVEVVSLRLVDPRYSPAKQIRVSESDALRFACNAVNIGRTILLNEVSNGLSERLHSLGYHVLQVDLSEFMKAGGAAKCLVLRLSEMDVTHRA
jgi:ornithine--oxo-acid transaminase